jgi:hypothetical protein
MRGGKRYTSTTFIAVFVAGLTGVGVVSSPRSAGLLEDHLLVTWYGNPRSPAMGVLGERTGDERAAGLSAEAAAYQALTRKTVMAAYELVAVVAQCTAGADGKYRRRETAEVIDGLLAEARAHAFRLVLDVQPGRSTVAEEVAALAPFLRHPDVYLALDPEYDMEPCEIPGEHLGQMPASEINVALDTLEAIIARNRLPPKVLIVHQFRLDMLPDKAAVRRSPVVDLVLDMDGFGSRALKTSSYRAVMRQGLLDYAGIKLFFRQDTDLFTPGDVLALRPAPAVVIYQ